jgi:hypothetical protein
MVFNPGHGVGHEAEHQSLAVRLAAAEAALAALTSRGVRNYLLNGNMDVSQRSIPGGGAVVAGQYMLDQWQFIRDGTAGTVAMGQIAFGVGTNLSGESSYYNRINQTVAGTTQTYKGFQQKIEDVQQLAFQTVTASFWVRSSLLTVISSRIDQNFGTGGSAAVLGTQTATFAVPANAWTFCQWTYAVPDVAGKVIGVGSSTVFLVFDITANGGQPQVLDLCQTALVLGSTAIPFPLVKRSFGEELIACMRYYQKSFPYGTTPAQNAGLVTVGTIRGMVVVAGVATTYLWMPFPVPMRVLPTTVTFYNPQAANAFARNSANGTDATATVAGGPTSDKGLAIDITGIASWAVGHVAVVNWSAEAVLP